MGRSRRYEFSKEVRRAAVKRAAGRCEAIGEVYDLEPGQRCNGDLARGFEIDHYPAPATDPDSDTLENAVVCCLTCHAYKTRTYDTPMQAKSKRIRDKASGVHRSNARLGNGNNQHTATRALTKGVGLAYFEDAK